jgi:hypothetical protein
MKTVCQFCNGVGDVRWPLEDGGSPWMVCPECNGTGYVGPFASGMVCDPPVHCPECTCENKHFPTANRIEPGYGGRYGIPEFTRHYWTFDNTPNSAGLFLSNQLCRYGFTQAWEDRPCSTG